MTNSNKLIQTTKLWPVCNPDFSKATFRNCGYTKGLFPDGTPFAAELLYDEQFDTSHLTLYFQFSPKGAKPAWSPYETDEFSSQAPQLIQDPHKGIICSGQRVLCLGMRYSDEEPELEELQEAVAYLEQQEVIEFTTPVQNGILVYIKDLMGQELVLVTITMKEEERELCCTPLSFVPFAPAKQLMNLIAFPSSYSC